MKVAGARLDKARCRLIVALVAGTVIMATAAATSADQLADCYQTKEPQLELSACTSLLEAGGLDALTLAKVHTGRGVALVKLGRAAEALADHSRAIELAPDFATAIANRGSAYNALGEFEKAIGDLDRAIALDSKRAVALNSRAWALHKLGRQQAALADIEAALARKPGAAALLDTRGHIREALGEAAAALADFRAALAQDPSLTSSRDGLIRLGAPP